MPDIINNHTIKDNDKVTLNRNAIEHRATWMGLSYEAAKEAGIDGEQMIERSMLSPATCCLVNPDRERTVELAFSCVKQISDQLREKYKC